LLKDPGQPTSVLRAATEALLRIVRRHPDAPLEAGLRQQILELDAQDIAQLAARGRLEVEAAGAGIFSVTLRLRPRAAGPMPVRIPAGTFFLAQDFTVQSMIATEEVRVRLAADVWTRVTVPAAGTKRPARIPAPDDRFELRDHRVQVLLRDLLQAIARAPVEPAVRQAAVWILTDDADYRDLGVLLEGHALDGPAARRLIGARQAALAMRLCDQSGTDITERAIWADRDIVLAALDDAVLKRWLIERGRR
jgi:hypothetical protein